MVAIAGLSLVLVLALCWFGTLPHENATDWPKRSLIIHVPMLCRNKAAISVASHWSTYVVSHICADIPGITGMSASVIMN